MYSTHVWKSLHVAGVSISLVDIPFKTLSPWAYVSKCKEHPRYFCVYRFIFNYDYTPTSAAWRVAVNELSTRRTDGKEVPSLRTATTCGRSRDWQTQRMTSGSRIWAMVLGLRHFAGFNSLRHDLPYVDARATELQPWIEDWERVKMAGVCISLSQFL